MEKWASLDIYNVISLSVYFSVFILLGFLFTCRDGSSFLFFSFLFFLFELNHTFDLESLWLFHFCYLRFKIFILTIVFDFILLMSSNLVINNLMMHETFSQIMIWKMKNRYKHIYKTMVGVQITQQSNIYIEINLLLWSLLGFALAPFEAFPWPFGPYFSGK